MSEGEKDLSCAPYVLLAVVVLALSVWSVRNVRFELVCVYDLILATNLSLTVPGGSPVVTTDQGSFYVYSLLVFKSVFRFQVGNSAASYPLHVVAEPEV